MGLAWLAAGCAGPPSAADRVQVREVTPEFLIGRAGTDAGLAADRHGRVALTFVTPDSNGRNLWLAVSRDSGLTFSTPVRVNHRPGSVVSDTENRPVAAFGPRGELAVAWSDRRADTSGVADLMACASGDAGQTLSPPVRLNDDRAPDPVQSWSRWWAWTRLFSDRATHRFAALAYLPDGSLFAAWVDGREAGRAVRAPGAALYSATSTNGGWSWSANARIAGEVCDACRPVALADAAGRVAVAYRSARGDRRDPALAVSFDGGRTFPLDTVMAAEEARPRAPAGGPALSWNDAAGGTYAWESASGPAVHLLPWHAERGVAGVKRSLGDSLDAASAPRLDAMDRATLIAVEARPAGDTARTVLAVRLLGADGGLGPWTFLGAEVRGGAVAGLDAHTALACWTEHEDSGPRVRVARLRWTARR